ncbi:hypothetical protein BDD12DRAFT_413328 [Trichophaea hybrida]|nr:hypothetical protein BDD12DRAFT_413328 [Trichophaea hybrida]
MWVVVVAMVVVVRAKMLRRTRTGEQLSKTMNDAHVSGGLQGEVRFHFVQTLGGKGYCDCLSFRLRIELTLPFKQFLFYLFIIVSIFMRLCTGNQRNTWRTYPGKKFLTTTMAIGESAKKKGNHQPQRFRSIPNLGKSKYAENNLLSRNYRYIYVLR